MKFKISKAPWVATALITPFYNGKVDFISLKKLLKFQIENKIDGLIVCGSTAETATLTEEEKIQILDFIILELKKMGIKNVPLFFGCGTNNTKATIELIKKVDKKKIAGYLAVTPYYNKPPQRGLVAHFKKIASATDKPILLYNVPARTACSLELQTVKELSKVKNIVGIKEASGHLNIVQGLAKNLNKKFIILSGDDDTFVQAIQMGARGVISVVSHVIPEECKSLENEKKIKEISKIAFIETNPIPIKWMLKKMKIIRSAELRLPLVELDKKLQKQVEQVMKDQGLL